MRIWNIFRIFFRRFFRKVFTTNELKYVFAIIAFIFAFNMFKKNPLKISNKFPKSKIINIFTSLIIGFVSSLMGVGAGTIGVPYLVSLSITIHKAIGTAAALGLFISAPSYNRFGLLRF